MRDSTECLMVLNLEFHSAHPGIAWEHFDLKHPSTNHQLPCLRWRHLQHQCYWCFPRTWSENRMHMHNICFNLPFLCFLWRYGLKRCREGPCITCQGVEALKGSSTTHLRKKEDLLRSMKELGASCTFQGAGNWNLQSSQLLGLWLPDSTVPFPCNSSHPKQTSTATPSSVPSALWSMELFLESVDMACEWWH